MDPLTRNADGTHTYTPKRGYSGIDGFSYTVSDGSLSATAWIAVNVARDEDDCHNDKGNHHGYDHGEHKGYASGDDRGASIVVRSTDPNAAPVSIDWNGSAGSDFTSLLVNQAEWLPLSLGIPQPDRRSLAEITGLVVRIGR